MGEAHRRLRRPLASRRALRSPLAGLLLQPGDEAAQLRRGRLAPPHGGQWLAHIEPGETPVPPDVPAPPGDAVGERDSRFAAAEFADLETVAALARDIESAAVAARRQEHVIVAALDHL